MQKRKNRYENTILKQKGSIEMQDMAIIVVLLYIILRWNRKVFKVLKSFKSKMDN